MESLTKNILKPEQIMEMVSKAFGEEKKVKDITELKQGYFNAAYVIQFQNREEVILKIAPKETTKILSYEKNIMGAEVEALQLIKKQTKVPVPTVYHYDASKELCDSEYFFMEKIVGDNYQDMMESFQLEQKEKIETELGFLNHEINQIKGNVFGYFAQPKKQSGKWGEAFYNIVSDILNDGIALNIKLPYGYEEIQDLVKKYLYACDLVKEPRLVHWDLWPGNVIINNGKISGIIDLERALWADPLMEYYFSSLSDSTYFSRGYKENLFCDDTSKIRRELYNLYLYLVMKIECKYRGYEDSPQNEWAGKMIAEVIKRFRFL